MASLDERSRLDPRASSVIVEVRGGGILHSTPSGHLLCRNCHEVWCQHISETVMAVRDSQSILADLDRLETIDCLVVPVIPTEHIFADVWLRKYRPKEVWKAYLLEPGPPDKKMHADAQFLGFFHRGEGRLHLRQLVVQMYLPNVNDPRFPDKWTRCNSTRHDRQAQKVMRDECAEQPSKAGRRFAHLWCITWYRKCYNCFAAEGSEPVFDPDLIPKM